MATRQEMLDQGKKYYCLGCRTTYVELPVERIDKDGHGGHNMNMCRCGCDLFANLADDTPV